VPSTEGAQGEVALIEPNGDRYVVRCLVTPAKTEVNGEKAMMDYLHKEYGYQRVGDVAAAEVVRFFNGG